MALTKVTYSMIEGAPVNVLDFGADPTGVADSTTAIQAAVSAGTHVVFPFGTYKFAKVTKASGSIYIEGNGSRFLTILNPTFSTSQNFFEFNGCDAVRLNNFICDGGQGTSTAIISGATNDDDGIRCENCDDVAIDFVTVTGWSSGSNPGVRDSVAIFTLNCGEVLVQNSRIEYVSKEGIHDIGSNTVRFINNSAFLVGWSPFSSSKNTLGVFIIGNNTNQTGLNAPSVSMVPINYVSNVIVSNNTFIEHGPSSSFSSNYDNTYGAPGVVVHVEDSAGAYTANNWQITNNVFVKMRYGFYDSTTLSTKNNFLIQGNQFNECYECVLLFNRVNNIVISNNVFREARRGLQFIDSFGSQHLIEGNTFDSMQGSAITYQGDSSGAVSSRLVCQNNTSINTGLDTASSVYRLRFLGESIVQNNVAITGPSGNVSSHFEIVDSLPIVLIQNNTALGSSSGNPFNLSGASTANRVLRFNQGYGLNTIGTTNPSSGNTWQETTTNGVLLSFGNYRMWVDASGKLRIRAGAPTSDTDGTVVGTQT
jgi:hypothetical protein